MALSLFATVGLNYYMFRYQMSYGLFPVQDTGLIIGVDPGRSEHLLPGDEDQVHRVANHRAGRPRGRQASSALLEGGRNK